MKRTLCTGLAVFLMTMCFVSCSNSENNNSDDSAPERIIIPEENRENAENMDAVTGTDSTETGKPDREGAPQLTLDLDAEYDESKFLNYVDVPSCKPVSNADEDDFTGMWEADVIVKGDTAYDTICGIPLSATGHLVISENGSGEFINIQPVTVNGKQQGGPPQNTTAEQPQAEAAETELPLTWAFENGSLNVSVTIPVGPPEDRQAPDALKTAGESAPDVKGPPPKQMTLQMTDDGRILTVSADSDGTMTSAYYRKVDSFEAFDWSTVRFDFDSVCSGKVNDDRP